MRLVLDTNVLVSAVIASGKPRALLQRIIDGRDVLVSSPLALQELVDVLRRPKFRLREESVHRILSAVAGIAEVIQPKTRLHVVTSDPDDDRFLELALDGRSDLLVSGDRHLLDLGSIRGIPIMTVAEALARLDS